MPELVPRIFELYLTMASWKLQQRSTYGSGLQVFTALDVVVQERTRDNIPKWLTHLQNKASMNYTHSPRLRPVISPKDGTLVAVYGGSMEHHTDFNRATQARRQAGSASNLSSMLWLSQERHKKKPLWKSFDTVHNYKHTFQAPMVGDLAIPLAITAKATLAAGLARSLNIATASLLVRGGGPEPLIDLAKSMGLMLISLSKRNGTCPRTGRGYRLEAHRFAATIGGGRLAHGVPVISGKDLLGRERIIYSSLGHQII